MQRLYFTLRGTLPLLMHNAEAMGLSEEDRLKPESAMEAAAYRLPSGDLCFPAAGVRKAMLTAASGRRVVEEGTGRRRTATPLISASALVVDEWFPLLDSDGKPMREYATDARGVVIRGRGRVLRYRPRIELPWYLRCVFSYNPRVALAVIEDVLESAGATVGIGDFRIEKKGTYGGFTVADIRVE